MDTLTHGLVGAAIGRAGFQEKLGPKCATIGGIFAAEAADLDVVFHIIAPDGPIVHRGISHSLTGMVVGVVLATLVIRLFAKKAEWIPLFSLVALGYASHVFLDSVTAGGVALFAPFTSERMALSWLFVVDLCLLALLISPWVLRKFMSEIKAFRSILIVCALYISMAGFAHGVAEASLELTLTKHQIDADSRYVMPAPFAPIRWNAVAFDEENYYQLNLSLPHVPTEFSQQGPHNLRHPAVDALRRSEVGNSVFGRYRAPIATVERLGEDRVRIIVDDTRFNHWFSQRRGTHYFRFVIEMKQEGKGRWVRQGPGLYRTDYD